MIPGPTTIRSCSHCGHLIAEFSLLSGNTFGSISWTDGKHYAPMLPDSPSLVKCPHCDAMVWMYELEVVGNIQEPWFTGDSYDGVFKDVRKCPEPILQDFLSAIASVIGDVKKERYIRIRAWWAGNDRRRNTPKPRPVSEQDEENMLALASMMDEEIETDCLMKAELFRELGMFEESLTLLNRLLHGSCIHAAAQIRDLAERGIKLVHQLK